MGFEPTTPISQGKRLAGARTRPLCDPSIPVENFGSFTITQSCISLKWAVISFVCLVRLCYDVWRQMAVEVNVFIDNGFEDCPGEDWLRSVAERVLTAQDVARDVELGLMITNQERVRELNRIYRGKDRPTDVLAFYMNPPAGEAGLESASFIVPPDGVLHLGEVIISYPLAVTQAQKHRHSVRREMAVLIIHGVLHLLGYDHEKPEQRRQMRAREAEILSEVLP